MDQILKKTLMKPREAALYLRISVNTLYMWLEVGKIEGVKVSRRCVRIRTDSLRKVKGVR